MIDMRRTLRASMKAGGAVIDLKYLGPREKEPPIVALLDISGSMSQYTRLFLHFLHSITDARKRVTTFLFGTRLTNVTRAIRQRDPDEALAACSAHMWSTGRAARASPPRCATSTSTGRAACSAQGAVVLLITDGLERDADDTLAFEMDRLHRSCRRLIWLNPLLRFEGFEARAKGVRTMLPHVDELRPIHNLEFDDRTGARAVGRAGEGLRSETDGCSRWPDGGSIMLTRDEDILKAAEDWRKAGRDVALATVVETWGSAPRPVGSNLVIDNEGNFLGTVSGGCVEGAVVTEAMDVIDSGKPKMLEFGVADETAWNVGPVLRRHHPGLCGEGELT